MTFFVLVHGGWQGAWCWDGVRDALHAEGHRTLAPTWLGAVDGRPLTPEETTINAAGARITRAVAEAAGDDDVVLVGHSGGGAIVQSVADRFAHRVSRVIYVDAVVLRDGEAFVDVMPFPEGFAGADAPIDAVAPAPPSAWWGESFMNGASPELIEETARRLIDVPLVSLTRPVHLPRYWQSEPSAGYVFLRDDIAVPAEVWRGMAERLSDPAVFECDGPHQAMLTHPRQLAKVLIDASY
ncbi:esterase [Virgisporangium aliadipatigenens]|uniref:Esterase n=1 Tax=Virgisporangium aliadipatigenens TaxID=741659 RepID=A0A8J3YKM0_9ACTN|nr:alpha/beta fold hydrolase [Virgisporangium aliadipatigenens]GIJ46921.1 esterase [Virgisporangium aliadipatigenens]